MPAKLIASPAPLFQAMTAALAPKPSASEANIAVASPRYFPKSTSNRDTGCARR